MQVAQGDTNDSDSGTTSFPPRSFLTKEIQELAQIVLGDTDNMCKQALKLVNAADDEVRRLNALLDSYNSAVTDLQNSNLTCTVDDITVSTATFQRCVPVKASVDSMITVAKEVERSLFDQLRALDHDLVKITNKTQKKLKIAELYWLFGSEFYHFVIHANNNIIARERYDIQTCVDETSEEIRYQVEANLSKMMDCFLQANKNFNE